MTLRDLLGEGPPTSRSPAWPTTTARGARHAVLLRPGFTRDGHDFAPDAVERGAAALVVARPLGLGVPEVA